MSYFEIIKRYMQFQKKTSVGKTGLLVKLTIKIAMLFIMLSLLIVIVDKINFPYPNKKIEKKISDENFKIVK